MKSSETRRPRPIQVAVDELVLSSTGLGSVRATLSAYARLTRPILVRGEITTVRALLPQAFAERLILQVDCSSLADADAGHGLGALLRAHQRDLAQVGLLVLFDVDRLNAHDQDYLGELARHGVIDPRGQQMTARLICQVDHRLVPVRLDVPRGVFLEVEVPPLRARPMDARHLVESLVDERLGSNYKLSEQAAEALGAYAWANDLPELVTAIERLEARRVLGELPTELEPTDLGVQAPAKAASNPDVQIAAGVTLKEQLAAVEEAILRATLVRLQGNKSQAAKGSSGFRVARERQWIEV